MYTLNNNELMSIYGGGIVRNIIERIKFAKFCIWEYFDKKRSHKSY